MQLERDEVARRATVSIAGSKCSVDHALPSNTDLLLDSETPTEGIRDVRGEERDGVGHQPARAIRPC